MVDLRWDGNYFRNEQSSSGATADLVSHSGKLQQGYRHSSLTEGLVAYYPMEKGEGEVTRDGALNNTGQIQGGLWSIGKIGDYSVSFDNSNNEYIKLPGMPEISGTSSFTISLWIYYRSGGGGALVWFNKNGNLDNAVGILNEGADNDSKYQYYVEKDGKRANNANFGADKPTNEWSHVVLTFKDSTARFYENGSEIDSDTGPNITPEITEMYIAGDVYRDEYVDAKFNDVRIYDRELSRPEIKALYNLSKPSGTQVTEKQVPSQDQGGISRYKLNGDVADSWGNNDGTNNGVSYVEAVYGKGGKFESINNDYVSTKISSLGDTDGKYTISFWLKFNGSNSTFERFIGNYNNTNDDIWIGNNSSDDIRYQDDSGGTVTVSNALEKDKWIFITMVSDGSATYGYKNGSLIGTQGSGRSSSSSTGQNLLIGEEGNGNYTTSTIDDVRIYNTALTPQQVEKLYHKGAYRIPRESTLQ